MQQENEVLLELKFQVVRFKDGNGEVQLYSSPEGALLPECAALMLAQALAEASVETMRMCKDHRITFN